jgi:N-acetylneuraminic acid mutarotase
MRSRRSGHTATLLNNSQVLVSGGYDHEFQLGAEEYDPASGTWSTVSPLIIPRRDYAATLLNNGQVLVSGGLDTSGLPAAAELYTP